MSAAKLPDVATMTVISYGEGQHLFEPMAARCTTTTIISSSSCTF
ncbi:MAG: plantazolicin family TOMM peptide [Propionibacteriaceae bacterium]|nr:plantazolicin family TOMM peptide [Propionibacteriaceae bacterium]